MKDIYKIVNADVDYSNLLLKDYLLDWLSKYVEKNLAVNTISGYSINVKKHIIPEIGDILICDLTPYIIQVYYWEMLNKGLSATSVLYIHRVLHKALVQACRLQILEKNVCDFVELPRKKHFEIKVYNEIQIFKLLKATENSFFYLPIFLTITLGLRRGEVLGLKWSDIDYEYKTLCICRTQTRQNGKNIYTPVKTKKSYRSILLSNSLCEYLKHIESLQGSKCEFIILNRHNVNMTACSLNKAFKRVLKKTGLPHIRFHDLRHTNATLMLKNKIQAKIVSERLGHSNIAITLDLYSHVANEMQSEAANIFDEFLK